MFRWLACISREERGWTGIEKGGEGRMVMFITIIICVQLSVWSQWHYCKSNSTARCGVMGNTWGEWFWFG